MNEWISFKTRAFLFCTFLLITTVSTLFAQNNLNIYGFFSTRGEKVFNLPNIGENGETIHNNEVMEWSNPFVKLMLQHYLNERFKVFVNLSANGDDSPEFENYWGEYSAAEYFNIRVGKMYRKFGLYNELLNTFPLLYGIEPPELFDDDHLIVSRTTTLMLHGQITGSNIVANYGISTDNGEGGPAEDLIPFAWDFNLRFSGGKITIGTSGYTSGGATSSDVGLAEGSPKSGVLPWMQADKFNIFGGYLESAIGGFLFQSEYWVSKHTAERDPHMVMEVINNASLNAAQLNRFLLDNDAPVSMENINLEGNYQVQTWYIRSGYSISTALGEIAPYLQWDYYENPETIQNKTYGGDNEAGYADDGKFSKATIGAVYRPVHEVAIKLDGSSHIQKFNGKTESYPELRLDISFMFGS